MKRVSKNLTKAVTLSVLLMLPYGMAQAATTYTEAISGADDNYTADIKSYDKDTNTYIYNFSENDKLKVEGKAAIDGKNSIKINNRLDIIADTYAISISDDKNNVLIDRQYGGNIKSTSTESVILLKGQNNKLFLGNGIIKLNQKGKADSGVLEIDHGNNNLIVYGEGILKGKNLSVSGTKGIDGVLINEAFGSNKIILGYKSNQNEYNNDYFNKFDNSNNYHDLVDELGEVSILLKNYVTKEQQNSGSGTRGLFINTNRPNTENGKNIIAAGKTNVYIKVNSSLPASTNGISANSAGVQVSNLATKQDYIIALKSIKVNTEVKNESNGSILSAGMLSLAYGNTAKSLISVNELSDIDVKAEGKTGSLKVYGVNSTSMMEGNSEIKLSDVDIYTNTIGGESVENVGIKGDAGIVNVIGKANISVTANDLQDKEKNKVYGIWSTNGGNITINGKTTISTSGGQDIAVVAGTEGWKLGEDGKLPVVEENGINTVNLNYQNGAGSEIKGDIISGYGGNITIGNADGISTLSTRNNAGTLNLTGDALSANGGKLSINLTSGSTWTGRADDYQDADLANWADKHEEQFNPKFSHDIAASGTVNVNLAEGATWDVTGQSWLTKLEGTGGIIDMRNGGADDTSHAVHIGDLEGSHTFVMDLDTEHSVSDMLFIKGNAGGEQKLWINSINGLENLKDGDSLRFATVNSEGLTFSGDYNFGSYGNAKNGIMLADNGVMNNAFVIKSEKYDVNDSKKENEGYNGGTEFDEVKPGDEYVDENYADATNWLLAKDSSGDKVSDAGKTIINMSKVNYNNAIYMDRLNKRLGEARYISPEDEQGMWVRIRHDRIGKDDAFRSQNTMYEMGYDVKQDCDNGERRVGMAIDYMDGKAEYTGIAGDGDVKRYGLWLYDTWLGDKGHYTDYVLKWGHLENDFDIMARSTGEKITGDYSNNVFSASAEYGKKNDMGGGWYFEPQAQLQFARVTGADYVTSQDTKVSLDSINSLIGRAGFRLGRDLNENSTVYLKADLLHEFMGDQMVTAADATGTLREEFENKGTWYDVGFGFAAKMSKNSYAFMDFEKSFGNDNDETYQINAGMQWSF